MSINPPKSEPGGTKFCFSVIGGSPQMEVHLTGINHATYTIERGPKPGVLMICIKTPAGSKGVLNIRVGSGREIDRGAVLIY